VDKCPPHDWDSRLKGSAGTETTYIIFCNKCDYEVETDV